MIGVLKALSQAGLLINKQKSFSALSTSSQITQVITFLHQFILPPKNSQANLEVDEPATDKPLSDKSSESEVPSDAKSSYHALNPPSSMEVGNSFSSLTHDRANEGELNKTQKISSPAESTHTPQSSPPSQNGSLNVKSLIALYGGGSSSVSKSTSGTKLGSAPQSPQLTNPPTKSAKEISSGGSLALRPISPESQSKRALSPQLSPPSSPALSPITPAELFKPLPSTLSQFQSTSILPSPRKLEFSQNNSPQLSLVSRNFSQPLDEGSRSNEMPRHNGDPILGATPINPSDQLSRVTASQSNYTVFPDYRREFIERRHRQPQSSSSLNSSYLPVNPKSRLNHCEFSAKSSSSQIKSSPTKSTKPKKEKDFYGELVESTFQLTDIFFDNLEKFCMPTKEPMVVKANQLNPKKSSGIIC
jgi:hypothetical protein